MPVRCTVRRVAASEGRPTRVVALLEDLSSRATAQRDPLDGRGGPRAHAALPRLHLDRGWGRHHLGWGALAPAGFHVGRSERRQGDGTAHRARHVRRPGCAGPTTGCSTPPTWCCSTSRPSPPGSTPTSLGAIRLRPCGSARAARGVRGVRGGLSNVGRVDVLGYHRLGREKYAEHGLVDRLGGSRRPRSHQNSLQAPALSKCPGVDG